MSHLNVRIVGEITKLQHSNIRPSKKPKLKLGDKKQKKSQAKDKQPATYADLEEEPEVGSNEMELDSAVTLWAKSPRRQSSELSSFEDDVPEDTQDKW